jgi:hypothetical protein
MVLFLGIRVRKNFVVLIDDATTAERDLNDGNYSLGKDRININTTEITFPKVLFKDRERLTQV